MKITEAQIERYFNNECDAKERQAISDYFIRHPELLAKYLTEQSWENFEPEHSMQLALSKKILSAIRTKTYATRRRIIIRRNWAAAAAAVLVTGMSTIWFTQFNNKKPVTTVAATMPQQAADSIHYQRTFNTTNKTLSLVLEDSSRVQLAPNSELSYPVPFKKDKRNIVLKGEAVFDVAKDQARPFTVYAGQLTTTALGTVFSISAFEGKNVRVHLLSGKVRVDADSTLMAKGMKSAILLPGQELRLNAMQHMVISGKKEKMHKHSTPILSKQKSPSASQQMIFHNETLENIFRSLTGHFKTNIIFKADQVAGMTFTGKFDPEKETLLEFIQTISLLNNLSAVSGNGAIQVTVQ